MIYRISYLFLCSLSTLLVSGQTKKFQDLTNDLMLRIMTHQSDSNTYNFLKKYCPYLVTIYPSGGWVAYPPDADTTPDEIISHSLVFTKHPFVEIKKMTEGQLVLITREKHSKLNGLRNYYLTFSFDSKNDAEQEFDSLCSLYKPVSVTETLLNKNDKQIAVYKLKELKTIPDQVEFILTQDGLFDNKYKIIFGTTLQLTHYYKID